MDDVSAIQFDDDITAFNGKVAVTTGQDVLPLHTEQTTFS
jgi:hypothetical protein